MLERFYHLKYVVVFLVLLFIAMQYLGGKTRLAKPIVAAINNEVGRIFATHDIPFWDPFCGGLSMSVELAKNRSGGLVSDISLPLISTYKAVQAGWEPPTRVTPEEYQAGKLLDDTDPLKAFLGFGCSFGGKWFGGYARRIKSDDSSGYAERSSRVLKANIQKLQGCTIARIDFLATQPSRPKKPMFIYADPPYAGTTGYKGTPKFDHELFWERISQWEALDVPCFVSEFACPLPHNIILEIPRPRQIRGKNDGKAPIVVDRVFRLKPHSIPQA